MLAINMATYLLQNTVIKIYCSFKSPLNVRKVLRLQKGKYCNDQ